MANFENVSYQIKKFSIQELHYDLLIMIKINLRKSLAIHKEALYTQLKVRIGSNSMSAVMTLHTTGQSIMEPYHQVVYRPVQICCIGTD